MDFGFSEALEAFRDEVRRFIDENVTPEIAEEIKEELGGRGPLTSELYRKLAAKGWLAISWPKEYSGQGGDPWKQFIVEEEFSRADLSFGGGGSGAAAILAAGTEEQKQHFIPGIIRGEIRFCLGFTEPSGGTDLASLQCRAEADGDDFIINGQKTFTSAAHSATHIYLMARTNPEVPKHRGISIFLIPMDTPGITVRPLWTLQSIHHAPPTAIYPFPRVNETFFENVRVPRSSLLGRENDGWYVGASGLNLDRAGAWRYQLAVRKDESIINWIKATELGAQRVADSPAIRDRLAEMWIEAQVCRLMTMRSMSMVERGLDMPYEASAEKVWSNEHAIHSTESIAQILGPYAQLMSGSEDTIEEGTFSHSVLGAWLSANNHGSVNIMRDQVARRGIGLPRGS